MTEKAAMLGTQKRALTPMGASMLKNSAWPPEMKMLDPIVNVLVFFDGKAPTVEVIANNYEEHLWPCYKFNSCAEDGYFVQRHDTMDRAYHFEEVTLADEAAIDAFAQQVMSQRLDAKWPLWKVYVLNASRGRSAIFGRLHHCIGDGIGLLFAMSPMIDCAGEDPISKIPLPAALLPKEFQNRKPKAAGSGEKPGCCKSATMFTKGFALPLLAKHDSELAINLPLASRTPFLVYNGNRVYTRFPAIPMTEVKDISKRNSCSVNDVLMAALTGALRRFGAEVRGDSRLQGETSGTLHFSSLMMMALPRPIDSEDRTTALANKLLFVSCPLPIDEPSPLGRLNRVARTTENLKDTSYVAGLAGITAIASKTMPIALQAKTASELFSKHSLLVSCTPATTEPVEFPKGDSAERVSEIHLIFPNCVPQVSIITYNGRVCANLVADPALYPEP
eukprot:CAMPEP_0179111108 /NCGR_PEP_ID=MMETSP0796-20121207/51882_1 /TAXON_ID=73915 /ORGANISM="Pyrodinium bahamense, Strain pbaha01" /LENGTH=447 /DNA_ID=CAMNT_0020809253 /DNA_START=10 /DNA_END=1350 /DNA_ORIENTATION=-